MGSAGDNRIQRSQRSEAGRWLVALCFLHDEHDSPRLHHSRRDRIRTLASASRWRSTWRWRSITRSTGTTSDEQLGPGRTGDFLTSPEASPYFGLTVARQLIEIWDRLGQPERWEIREYGAGTGVLAYDVLAGIAHDAPEAMQGLTYRLVERIRTGAPKRWPR